MTKEEKTLLTKVLCEQLPYGVKYKDGHGYKEILDMWSPGFHTALNTILYDGRPSLYLRPLPSMTKSEALDIAKLLLFSYKGEKILDVEKNDEGINIIVDDGVSSTEGLFYYYDEIVRSLETFDYLNAKHFDVRGILPNGLGIAAVGMDNPYNEKGGRE
jgi:hypothetical protein